LLLEHRPARKLKLEATLQTSAAIQVKEEAVHASELQHYQQRGAFSSVCSCRVSHCNRGCFVSLLAAYPMALTSDVCPCLAEKPSLCAAITQMPIHACRNSTQKTGTTRKLTREYEACF
jgi:hypothetical protein